VKADFPVHQSAWCLTIAMLATVITTDVNAQNRQHSFDYIQRLPIGVGVNSVRIADIDDDGRPDIVYARSGQGFDPGDVGVLLGRGDGTFDDAVVFSVGVGPHSARLADFDNDGILDLFVIVRDALFSNDRLITVTPGLGDGSFDLSRTQSVASVESPRAPGITDIDNDGDLDYFEPEFFDDSLIVHRGNGDGTLDPAESIPLLTNIRAAAAADLNDNDLTDLVAISVNGGNVGVFLADGSGSFVAGQTFMLTNASASSVVIEDVNRDGVPDACIGGSSGAIFIYTGNGDGTFTETTSYPSDRDPTSFVARDLDNDGAPELVVGGGTFDSGYISILPNNGDGTFGDTDYLPIGLPTTVEAVDFDADGNLELVAIDRVAGDILIVPGNDRARFGQSFYRPLGERPGQIAAGRMDADANPDIVLAGTLVQSLAGNGDGTFQDPFIQFGNRQPSELELIDLNNDTNLDLVYSTQNFAAFHTNLGDGNGGFGTSNLFLPNPGFPQGASFGAGDIDGDGDPDVVVGLNEPAQIQIGFNDGNGGFGTRAAIDGVGIPRTVTVGDLDGDDNLDIALGTRIETETSFRYEIQTLTGNGDGTFGPPVTVLETPFPSAITIADIDLDTNNDIAWTDSSDRIAILFGDGAGGYEPLFELPTGDGPFDLNVADLDGDGDLDLVTSNGFDENNSVYLRNSGGSYALQSVASGERSDDAAIDDFDGDGTPDLAVATFLPGGFPGIVRHDALTVFLGDIAPEILSVTAAAGSAGPGSIDFTIAVDDPDSDSFSTRWDFDGDDRFDRTADGLTTTWVYPEAGTFDVSARVVDAEGLSALAATSVEIEPLLACDVNGDQTVDITDIRAILAARNQPSTPPDPRDADGDGVITILDARVCILQCATPRCR
jgi:hypothetical protein